MMEDVNAFFCLLVQSTPCLICAIYRA